jgi:hypothetical protein
MMDPLPYDNEDDMIAEEMDFFDGDDMGPPQGYDDGQDAPPPPIDDMEGELEHSSRQGIDTSNNADDDEMAEDGSVPSPTVPAYGSGDDDDDPASVRDAYSARKRPIPQVLFKFERCVLEMTTLSNIRLTSR